MTRNSSLTVPTPQFMLRAGQAQGRNACVTTARSYNRGPFRVNFEWDEEKRRSNLQKHGTDFGDCEAVFGGLTVTVLDDRTSYGEARFITFGLLSGRVIAIAHTEMDDTIRVISMRKANRREQEKYFESIADGLGEN